MGRLSRLGGPGPASCLPFGLQKACQSCSVQGAGTMASGISYFNAELGTQSLLKINTKENPKVAKPILLPFHFFVPGSFVSSLLLWNCTSHQAHPECCRPPIHVLSVAGSPVLIIDSRNRAWKGWGKSNNHLSTIYYLY